MPFFRSTSVSFRSLVKRTLKKTASAPPSQMNDSMPAIGSESASTGEEKPNLEINVADAFHDPTVLDIRRSMVYGLNNLVIEVNKLTVIGSPAASTCLLKSSPPPTIVVDIPSKAISAPAAPCPASSVLSKPSPASEPRISPLADLDFLKVLGIGSSAQVYLVRNRRTNVRRALKVVPHADMSFGQIFSVREEQSILQTLVLSSRMEGGKPYFLELDASFYDTKNFYFLMPLYPTDIESEIIRCKKLPEVRSRFYFAEAYLGLSHLHSLGIIHRDIKPSNLLLSCTGHIVLTDFGLSRDFHIRPTLAERVFQPFWPYAREDIVGPNTPRRDGDDPRLKFTLFSRCGTGLHMAPELMRGETYSFGVDFWALAVSLYMMLTGRPPFDSETEEFDEVRKEILETELGFREGDDVSDIAQDFLFQMLEKCPEDRLHITEIEEHPFFAGVNWPLLETYSVPAPWVPDSDEPTFVLQEKPEKFVPGRPFEDEGPYPDFEWTTESDGEFEEVDLVETGAEKVEEEVIVVEGEVEGEKGEVEGVLGVLVEGCEIIGEKREIVEGCELPTKEVVAEEEKQPNAFKAFFQRLWPWSKNRSSTEHYPAKPGLISTSTLHLPPTPSCFSGLSSSSSTPWQEFKFSTTHSTTSSAWSLPSSNTTPTPTTPSTTPPLCPSPPPPSPRSAQSHPLIFRHVENGTGLLFKLRVWIKRLFPWTTTTRLVSRFELLG